MFRRIAFVLGFLVGAGVGWVLGILYAPQPGCDTRDALAKGMIELRDTAETRLTGVANAE